MTVKLSRLVIALTLLLALNPASLLHAQFSSTLEGVVQDSSGAVVPKAAVELTNLGTRVVLNTTTDSSGFYRFVTLAPGQYRAKITATGFNEVATELTLLTAQTMNLPITLTVAAQRQEVQITAQAPVLDTSDSRTEMTLGKVALNDLPLPGRALVNLVAVAPGVEGLGTIAGGSPGSAVDNFSTETQIDASANGRGSVANMFIVDGLDVTSNIRPGVLNLMPNPDSVQESSVQVNTFDVDYGRAASIQMVMTTKSGTDQFHGQVSDYFNYQALWAGTEFVHSYAPFHTNNISASVGGPILTSKHHLYFFFSIEPLRASTSTGNGLVTFEAPEFTAWAQQNYPNTLGTQLLTQFPPTHAITTGVSSTAADFFPTTCGTAATANIPCNLPMVDEGIFNSTNYRNGLQYNVRIDKYFSKDRIYGNYYRTGLNTGGGAVRPGMEETDHYITKSLQVNETHNFTSSTINEASFGLLRVEGISPLTGDFKIPVVSVVGVGTGIGDGFADGDFIQHNYHWRDVLMQTRGTHILKAGYEGWHGDDIALFAPCYGQPNYEFLNLLELVQDDPYAEGSLAYDPLTGQPAKGQYMFADTTNGAFVQDTWKVRRNFTLNYGVRWDEYGNPYPVSGTVLANFFLGPGLNPNDQIANGFMIQKSQVFNRAPMAFSPRAGFAWDTTGKGKWVVRGGFGIFHDWIDLGNDENGLKGNPPGWVLPTFIRGTTTPPVFGEGTSNTYPFGFPYPPFTATGLNDHGGLVGEQPSVGGIDPNLTSPSTYNYTVTLERELQRHLVASVGYSGSHSVNLVTGGGQVSATSYGTDINRFAGDLIENDNVLTRLNHSFGSITYAQNGSKATYNALIVALQGRFSRGFVSASYTRSSSYDDSQIYPTATNLSQYWSPSNWDGPNRFAFTGAYTLPGLDNSNPFLRHLTSGWEPSATSILQSGLPYTVYTNAPFEPIFNASGTQVIGMQPGSGDYNADGFDYDFPNAPSTGYKTATSRSAYLNGLFTASDFPVPTMGTEGNELANAFRGPGFAETDFALLKNDKISERLGLQLRFEFYNIFNRPNLNGVDSNLPDASFGRSVAQYNPRWIQFAVKLTF